MLKKQKKLSLQSGFREPRWDQQSWFKVWAEKKICSHTKVRGICSGMPNAPLWPVKGLDGGNEIILFDIR